MFFQYWSLGFSHIQFVPLTKSIQPYFLGVLKWTDIDIDKAVQQEVPTFVI